MSRNIGVKELFNILFRSFFIQTVWNYQSYLSIGFSYALVPVVRKLYRQKTDIINFLRRHLDFYNSHPYFSSFALGAIAKIEEDQVAEDKYDYPSLQRLKNALIGPLGALGDQLFWGNIKPASLLFGALGVIIFDNLFMQILILVIAFFVYNLPHIYIRVFGLVKGYQLGYQVYKVLNLSNFTILKKTFGLIGASSLGLIIGCALFDSVQSDIFHILIFLVSASVAYVFWKLKQNIYSSIVASLLLVIVLGLVIAHL
jgi:mannose/fructose/N-acetylgalactosamine-specific phosphotransferase system component IID